MAVEEREDRSTAEDGVAVVGGSTSLLITKPEPSRPGECWGQRHTLALLSFLGFAILYSLRFNLSVAIVAMVTSSATNATNETNAGEDVCPFPDDYDPSEGGQDGEFDWNEETQGMVLGAFFYGYLLTNFIGGRLGEHFGGKLVYGLGILFTGILTLLSPACARFSTGLFIAVRFMEGLTEGVTYPAMNVLMSHWIPPKERSKILSMVFAGAQFGTVVVMPVSGWLCSTDFLGGWPSAFYVFGMLAVLWSVPWFLLPTEYPATHPRISQEEKTYIQHYCAQKRAKPVPLPWKELVKSVPMWVLLIAHVGNNWGYYTLLTELPTYLNEIQHFEISSNGLVSGLPYLCMWFFSVVYGNIMDWLHRVKNIPTITIRKISMAIGLYVPMVGLALMCFVDCNSTVAILVLCVSVGFNGAIYSGYMCSHQDLSPNLAGSLMGITNTVGTIPGFVAPAVTGALTLGNQTLSAWRTVFLISSAVYLVSNLGYLLFMSADVQPWNDIKQQQQQPEEKKRF